MPIVALAADNPGTNPGTAGGPVPSAAAVVYTMTLLTATKGFDGVNFEAGISYHGEPLFMPVAFMALPGSTNGPLQARWTMLDSGANIGYHNLSLFCTDIQTCSVYVKVGNSESMHIQRKGFRWTKSRTASGAWHIRREEVLIHPSIPFPIASHHRWVFHDTDGGIKYPTGLKISTEEHPRINLPRKNRKRDHIDLKWRNGLPCVSLEQYHPSQAEISALNKEELERSKNPAPTSATRTRSLSYLSSDLQWLDPALHTTLPGQRHGGTDGLPDLRKQTKQDERITSYQHAQHPVIKGKRLRWEVQRKAGAHSLSDINKRSLAQIDMLRRIHRANGHLNFRDCTDILRGMGIALTDVKWNKVCPTCAKYGSERRPIRKHSSLMAPRATSFGERTHCDTFHWKGSVSRDGCTHAIVFVDDFSRSPQVYGVKSASAADAALAFTRYVTEHLGGQYPRSMQTDDGTEFKGDFNHFCNAKRVHHTVSPPHHPNSNMVERYVRIVKTMTKKMMEDVTDIPPTLWLLCAKHACFLKNMQPTNSNPARCSPHVLIHGELGAAEVRFAMAKLQPFGTRVNVHNHDLKRGDLGTYIGVHPGSMCPSILKDGTGIIVHSTDVTFVKHVPFDEGFNSYVSPTASGSVPDPALEPDQHADDRVLPPSIGLQPAQVASPPSAFPADDDYDVPPSPHVPQPDQSRAASLATPTQYATPPPVKQAPVLPTPASTTADNQPPHLSEASATWQPPSAWDGHTQPPSTDRSEAPPAMADLPPSPHVLSGIVKHDWKGAVRKYLIRWARYDGTVLDASHDTWEVCDTSVPGNVVHSVQWDAMLAAYARKQRLLVGTARKDTFDSCLQRHAVSVEGECELNYILNSMRAEQHLHQVGDDEDEGDDLELDDDDNFVKLDDLHNPAMYVTITDSEAGTGTDTADSDTCSANDNLFNSWARLVTIAQGLTKPDIDEIHDEETPMTLKEIQNHPNRKEWLGSYDNEIGAYKSHDVMDLIDRVDVPKHHRVHTLKPVMKLKQNQSLETIRRKVRITLRGFLTRHGLEYDQTYSPTLMAATFKTMMAVMAAHDLVGAGLDVKTAFLTAPQPNDVYCEVPERWNGDKPNDPTKVGKLKKSVYGCKDSSRNFYLKVMEIMLTLGFEVSSVDQCLFVKGDVESKTLVAVGFYVDDATIICSNNELRDKFLKEFATHLDITIDPLTEMLGIKIDKESDGSVVISQQKYVRTILQKLGFREGDKKRITHKTPLPTSSAAPPHLVEVPLDAEGITKYQQKLGCLIYCLGTRIDCCYAISKLCRYMHAPSTLHDYWADYMCEYLNGNPDLAIKYPSGGSKELTAYCDASYADGAGGKSTVGYLISYNGAVICFKSKLSKHVCTSTCMAEYVGLYECTKMLVLMRRLLKDLTVPQMTKTKLRCDNKSANEVANAKIPVASHRHIQMRYHYTRECLDQIEILHVGTQDQQADILTKALPRVILERHRGDLMYQPIKAEETTRTPTNETNTKEDLMLQPSKAEEITKNLTNKPNASVPKRPPVSKKQLPINHAYYTSNLICLANYPSRGA